MIFIFVCAIFLNGTAKTENGFENKKKNLKKMLVIKNRNDDKKSE